MGEELMRKWLSVLLVPAILLWLYGCGTLINHTTQMIYLQSDPPGASAVIDGVTRVQTPVSVKLKRGKDHFVTFEKEGYEKENIVIDHELSGWVWGNVLIGGLIGVAIDFGTGGAYKLDPDNVKVSLKPLKP